MLYWGRHLIYICFYKRQIKSAKSKSSQVFDIFEEEKDLLTVLFMHNCSLKRKQLKECGNTRQLERVSGTYAQKPNTCTRRQ